jgi:hypothetical protein
MNQGQRQNHRLTPPVFFVTLGGGPSRITLHCRSESWVWIAGSMPGVRKRLNAKLLGSSDGRTWRSPLVCPNSWAQAQCSQSLSFISLSTKQSKASGIPFASRLCPRRYFPEQTEPRRAQRAEYCEVAKTAPSFRSLLFCNRSKISLATETSQSKGSPNKKMATHRACNLQA